MNAIALTVALPLLAAFLLHPLARLSAPLARGLGPLVVLLNLAVLWSISQVPRPFSMALGGFAPPLGINFYVDSTALLFAVGVALLGLLFWPTVSAAVRTQVDALMLLLVASASGLALSGDLFNLYVFYELLAIATLGLMTVEATGRAYLASLRYLLISAAGSVLTLLGITLIYFKAGTVSLADLARVAPTTLDNPLGLAAFALLLLGFGVKAELFPVNFWVAEVYAAIPARLAALLAGLISKLAVLVIVRLLLLVFPQPEAAQMLLVLGIAGLVIGELAAFQAPDLRRLLAYSSIGQLGLIFIAFGLLGPAGVWAGLALMLHHLVAKSALFGLTSVWGGQLQWLRGVAYQLPWTAAAVVLLALSLVGVPPLPGFWAKLLLVLPLAQAGTALHLTALGAILGVAVLEAAYWFRIVLLLYAPAVLQDPAPVQPPAWRDRLVLGLGAGVLLGAMFWLQSLGTGLQALALQLQDRPTVIQTVLPKPAAEDKHP